MKVPLQWLREYVDLPDEVSTLIDRLTLVGLEVAGVRVIGLPIPAGVRVKEDEIGPVWDRDKVVIGEILSVEPHPNADRLSLPTVAYGQGRAKTMVTGAPNIKIGDKGQKVVLALGGSVLFDGHAEGKVLKELKPAKIRGVLSDAMVCSYKELGIADEHEGIIILENDAPVGLSLADFMGDIVIDLDVLPNMARCLSMIGVAREAAAILAAKLRLPPQGMQATGGRIDGQVFVEIADPLLSARYAAALIKNVTIGPAPGWMQRRLLYAGMRPINNIVDITNFVMLEWGQPLHAFDYDLLVQRAGGQPPTIIVRPARAGEVLATLDGQHRPLTVENLVIADCKGPIALAGVMGGAETEVTARTKNILLESANFDFVSIRRTMKQFNLPSESSLRFSRGVHPETVRPAAQRAADLMRQYAGGTICQGLVDCYPARLPPQVVTLSLAEIRRILGFSLPMAKVKRILQALEYDLVQLDELTLQATVPPHRRDVQAGAADLIEDLVRIYGYDRLPATLLADQLPRQHTNWPLVFEERVRDLLAGAGLQEVIAYSLTMPDREAPLQLARGEYVRLKNPVSSERVVLRQTVLAGVLEAAAANLRHAADVGLFELGPVYLPRANDPLPEEPRRLALVLCGFRQSQFWDDITAARLAPEALDFFDLKGIIEALIADLHLAGITYRPSTAAFLHPGRAATLRVGEKPAGDFGQLHPLLAQTYELGERPVLVGEFDVEALQAATPQRFTYTPVSRFPAALRDIAVIVPEAITAEQVAAEIQAAGRPLLCQIRLFDLYRGSSIPAGTKSLAYALSYQADDRTLTDKEVDKAHKKIEDRLKHLLQAQIRGK